MNPLVDFVIILAITYLIVVHKLIKYFQNDGQYDIPREEIIWGILPNALWIALVMQILLYPLWYLPVYAF